MTFHYEKDNNNLVLITMDMAGSVNTANEAFYDAMLAILEKLETDTSLRGVIITSAKSTFFAGGDLNDFFNAKPDSQTAVFERTQAIKALFTRLEQLPVPVVAAINGSALGGGFEICLACHHRIALNSPKVKIALPEVSLGLLPGGGGIVRLTKLLGLEKALPYLLDGKLVDAAGARSVGLIDATVESLEQLVPAAKSWLLSDNANHQQVWDHTDYQIPGGNSQSADIQQLINATKKQLTKKHRGLLPAPTAILDVAICALDAPVEDALILESQKFAQLVVSPQAKNMMSAFFFQMNEVNGGKSRPNTIATHRFTKVGVIGAGMMGQGIALVSALAGIKVILKDVSLEAANKGKQYSDKVLSSRVAKGRMTDAQKQQTLALITASADNHDLKGCELIIEAVFENMTLKNTITRETESTLNDNGIWASNTSTLPISQLAEASSRPENFIGMHFFSPVDRMPLIEIICGKKTSDETLAKAYDFAKQVRKTAIVVNDAIGFYTSRTISTQIQEAAQLLAEGVSAERIEKIGDSVGWPVSPLALQDEVSQKLSLDIIDTQVTMGLRDASKDPTPEGTALMRNLLSQGRGGRHHGGGYYQYDNNGKQLWPQLSEQFYRSDITINDQDIHDRLLFRPVIESLLCLEEGVLRTVADGNIGSILGIGAPAWTGGYIQFVNSYGLEKFINRCHELAERYGNRFNPPAIVQAKITANSTFR